MLKEPLEISNNITFLTKKTPASMLGVLNELWLVCCILTIFYDPIISDAVQ